MSLAKHVFRGSVLIAATLSLQSCTVGPDYQRPAVAVPSGFKERPDWKPASPDQQPISANWWEIFGDPLLNQLEQQIPANPSLAQAEAQFRQSKALAENARA